MFDIIIIGHLTHDDIKVEGRDFIRLLGGTAAYSSLMASRLGARVGVVSKIGRDFDFTETLRDYGVDLKGLRVVEKGTTVFENVYERCRRRVQRVKHMCEDISLRDIPATYFDARCFHLGPLIGEVEPDIVREASRRGILTSLDVQGYCRSLDMEGLVNIGRWDEVEVLRYVKVLKSDVEEALCVSKTVEAKEAINFFWGFGVEVVLVTMGEDGSLIGCEEMIRHIPAFKPNKIVDPTGAGDAYSAAFLVEYLRSKDPVRAALFASSAASFVLEGEGVSSIPSEDDVWDRCSVQEPTGLL